MDLQKIWLIVHPFVKIFMHVGSFSRYIIFTYLCTTHHVIFRIDSRANIQAWLAVWFIQEYDVFNSRFLQKQTFILNQPKNRRVHCLKNWGKVLMQFVNQEAQQGRDCHLCRKCDSIVWLRGACGFNAGPNQKVECPFHVMFIAADNQYV